MTSNFMTLKLSTYLTMTRFLLFFVTTLVFGQQTKSVDFKKVSATIGFDLSQKKVLGQASYKFEVLKPIDTISIDAQNMNFENILLNGQSVTFVNTQKQLQLIYKFKKGKNKLELAYNCTPKQALYFVGDFDNPSASAIASQIWTQGQGRYTSNWFPSFDDVNEKLIFNLSITFDKKFEVVSNGVLESKETLKDQTVWRYKMERPMSSYLLMLAIGEYNVYHQKSKSGVGLEFFLEKSQASKFETTYRDSKTMFDFLEKKIGVKYPWKIYRQIPVREFLYAGMENTSSTLFSSRYVVDSIGFFDRKYSNVNAHELAHQWFGDLITAQSGKDHWLQEGFATYYALLAEKSIYGDDYFYEQLYQSAQQIKYASRTDTIPILDAKASSLSFYQKGAWALFALNQAIGDKAFDKAVCRYLKKYAFKNVTTADFLNEIKKVSNYDTEAFSKTWLEDFKFDTATANDLLLKNSMMQLLFDVNDLKKNPLAEKEVLFKEIMQSAAYTFVKTAIVQQLKAEKFEAKKELLQLAWATNNLHVRQEVAAGLSQIPEDFRLDYESLLNDKSYQTQEIALYYLWKNFPEHRFEYLEKSKNWQGFNDYNLRTLWLSLALSTANYEVDKVALTNELIDFSSPKYEAITRQNALEKLIGFKILIPQVLRNLVNATTHHTWQFVKFGRDSIRKLLKQESLKTSFEQLLPQLNPAEQFQLKRL